jgi:glycosyltransferase involved in cell wall biosynthesis
MNILHIVGSISPAAGGPTEAIRMLIRYAPAGYACEVATLDDPAADFLADLPFPVHALGSARKRWFSRRLIAWLRANRDRFDGVIVHGLWEFTGLAARLCIAGHKPYVVFPHGMLDPYFKRRFPAKHLKKWLYWLTGEYWVLRRAERVLFTTKLEADLARQSFWLAHWKPMVVALGSEPPPADTGRLLQAFHARCPDLENRRFLLFLGRIDPKKGCDLLLDAFAATVPSNGAIDPLHLVIAGPDAAGWGEQLAVRAAALGCSDRIHWPGMLRGDSKWGAFAACEAFMLPSHQENFGIAVVEALASGRPVLLSDQINIAHDVQADGCGLVEPDTLAGTNRLLARWLALEPAEREAMSRRGCSTFFARYDMRRNTAAILRVFEAVNEPVRSRAATEPSATTQPSTITQPSAIARPSPAAEPASTAEPSRETR